MVVTQPPPLPRRSRISALCFLALDIASSICSIRHVKLIYLPDKQLIAKRLETIAPELSPSLRFSHQVHRTRYSL